MGRRSNKAIMELVDAYKWVHPDEDSSAERAAIAKALEGRKPRAAGGRFERRIAKDLRAALGEGWTVTRNQTDRQKGQDGRSAGEFTVEPPPCEHCGKTGDHDRDSYGVTGMMCHTTVRPVFPFCIECKDVAAFKLAHLWKSPVPGPLASTPKAEGFWAQAVRQAESVGKRPMLVWRDVESGTVLCAVQPRDPLCQHMSGYGYGYAAVLLQRTSLLVYRWQDVVKHAAEWV